MLAGRVLAAFLMAGVGVAAAQQAPPQESAPAAAPSLPPAATPAPVGPAPPLPVEAPAAQQPSPQAEALRSRLEDARAGGIAEPTRRALLAFYAARQFEPAWVRDGAWTSQARAVVARLGDARSDGLDPSDYQRPSFAGLRAPASPAEAAAAEVELGAAVLLYARHALQGRSDGRGLAPYAFPAPQPFVPDAVAVRVLGSATPVAELEALHPTHPGFLALRRELVRLTGKPPADAPRHAPIANGPTVRLGMSDPRVPALRERLAIAAGTGTRGDTMDAALVSALRLFQERSRIEATGTLGAATVRALNGEADPAVADRDRIARIVVNMERWRWLPRDLGRRHVWVNIPEQQVRVVEDGETRFRTRAVVGRPDTPTSVFSANMQYYVVNPSWNVPPGIARREMIPLLNNPDALRRRGIEIVRGANGSVSFRQPPGERNALGRIKFMFPNEHAIYLHDTPTRGLFGLPRRALSNGCVRVENPLAFAEAALAAENASAQRIQATFGGAERAVRLRTPVPVHLVNFTVEAGPDGRLVEYNDVYGLDARLRRLLRV